MFTSKLVALVATAFLASTVTADPDPIVIKGSKFFYKSNGTQFYIRGVDYQQNPATGTSSKFVDPLADSAGCQRDLPYLLKLRTNAVRVYAIDPTKSHDDCMKLFGDNGIYVVADLSSPQESIIRDAPAWNLDLYNRYTSVVDLMAKYTNTIGFFAGNEVANMVNNTASLPFVKAAVRDMKTYIKNKKYRSIYVGYAATDDATIRDGVRPYMDCGSVDTSVDFFGYNIYEWCSSSDSYATSGYKDRTAEFANYSVPVFFAEYGCNTVTPRTFPDTQPLFSSPMSDVWSGGLVYEYFQDTNNYGLVSIGSDSSVKTLSAYNAYSSQVAKVSATGVASSAYTPTNTALQSCPPTGANWNASSTLPPSPNSDLCNCQIANQTCVANSNVADTAIGPLLDFICSNSSTACLPIKRDGSTGSYGAFSMCSAKQQLSIAMNAFYVASGSNSYACDFGGNATTQSPSIGSCASSLQSAGGTFGTGTVSGGPSGSSNAAAHNVGLPAFDFGILAVGVYTILAFITGAGIFLW